MHMNRFAYLVSALLITAPLLALQPTAEPDTTKQEETRAWLTQKKLVIGAVALGVWYFSANKQSPKDPQSPQTPPPLPTGEKPRLPQRPTRPHVHPVGPAAALMPPPAQTSHASAQFASPATQPAPAPAPGPGPLLLGHPLAQGSHHPVQLTPPPVQPVLPPGPWNDPRIAAFIDCRITADKLVVRHDKTTTTWSQKAPQATLDRFKKSLKTSQNGLVAITSGDGLMNQVHCVDGGKINDEHIQVIFKNGSDLYSACLDVGRDQATIPDQHTNGCRYAHQHGQSFNDRKLKIRWLQTAGLKLSGNYGEHVEKQVHKNVFIQILSLTHMCIVLLHKKGA